MSAFRWAQPIIRPLGAALAVTTLLGAAAAPTIVGSVAALRNQVDVRRAPAAAPRPATMGQRMALGNQVQTGSQSHMQLLLLDRSSFTVGQNARLTIDRFVYDPGGGSFSATVAKGALRFMSGGGHGTGGAQIRTPVATIGIRGTIVDAVVGERAVDIARHEPALNNAGGDPETASLIVLRGPGPRDRRPGAISVEAGGKTVDLDRPLLAVYVPAPGAAPIGPFTISLSGQAVLNDLILPRLDRRLPQGGQAQMPARSNDLYDPFPNRPYPPGYVPGGLDNGRGGRGSGAGVPDIPLFVPNNPGPQGGGNQGGGGNPTGGPSPAPSSSPSPGPSPSP
ncbi:MAG: FecR domain-containing protein [Novosphingobium sp.]